MPMRSTQAPKEENCTRFFMNVFRINTKEMKVVFV